MIENIMNTYGNLFISLLLGEHYFINKFDVDYKINDKKKCKTCARKRKMVGSHSFSKSWLEKNKEELYYLDYHNECKTVYNKIEKARNELQNNNILINNDIINNNIYNNMYFYTKGISASKVFSLYYSQCKDCENIYTKTKIEKRFIKNKVEYGFSLLRYELYYRYKYNLMIENNKEIIKKFKKKVRKIKKIIYLIKRKKYNKVISCFKNNLIKIKNSIKSSSFTPKRRHSFHLLNKEELCEESYNNYKNKVLFEIEYILSNNIIVKTIKGKNFICILSLYKKFYNEIIALRENNERKNNKLLPDLNIEKNINKAINLYQSSYSNIEIKDNDILNKLNIFGYSKIDLSDIGLLFDKFLIDIDNKMYLENKAIYFFITPSKNIDYTRHITIFVPNEFKQKFDILINRINVFYDGRAINGETLFFILGLLKNDFLTIYSTEKEILDKMIEIKKFIPDEDSKMNEGIDITEQKMLDFYKKVEDLIK